jgi:hypothetical protein
VGRQFRPGAFEGAGGEPGPLAQRQESGVDTAGGEQAVADVV